MSMELNKAPAEQAGGDERVKCAVCVDSGKVYDISGEGPWKCYACTGSHEVIGYANGDELDNMLDDRTAVLSPVKTSFHTVPVYREARAALAQPSDEVVVTKNESGAIVSVTRQDKEGRVLSVIAESQPSPAQAEQAEAERPEVVARVVHSNPVVLGQCGPLNANDELMTVAQHAASVARWAEMFNRVEQQRDAALARVEQQERTIAGMNEAHAKLAGLYEAAQAQHSVPVVTPEMVMAAMAVFRLDVSPFKSMEAALIAALRKAAAPGKEGL